MPALARSRGEQQRPQRARDLAKAGIGEVTRALWPLLLAAIAALFVITYVPSLTTVVWRLAN